MKKPLVLIGGGTGFIGRHLQHFLKNRNYDVQLISRMPGPQRMTWHDIQEMGVPSGTHAVVNLAGQNIMDPKRRWTPGFKQNVWNSRVKTNETLSEAIISMPTKPKVFITMSGVGIYKPSLKEVYTEDSRGCEFDFFSKLCLALEHAGNLPSGVNCRHVVIRSGVVLGPDGGMIKNLFLPFSLGLGGPMGSGDQFLPFIHINDLVRLIHHCIETAGLTGVLNAVAPQTCTNKDFAKAFGKALGRPAVIPFPAAILNLIFHKERAKMITEGQKVLPIRTIALGFRFAYPDILSACDAAVHLAKELPRNS